MVIFYYWSDINSVHFEQVIALEACLPQVDLVTRIFSENFLSSSPVGDFFFRTLDIPEAHLSEDSVESVRRIFPTRSRGKQRSRIRDEVRVVLKDVETRDMIYSYAPNLADKRNEAGMRLEVPSHLLGKFKTLERYGRHLKSVHGQHFRWHIKYDDPELSMYLNVKPSEDERWNKVDYNTAREETRLLDTGLSPALRERLGSSASGTSSNGDPDPEVMDVTPPPITRGSLPTSTTLEKFQSKTPTPRWGGKK